MVDRRKALQGLRNRNDHFFLGRCVRQLVAGTTQKGRSMTAALLKMSGKFSKLGDKPGGLGDGQLLQLTVQSRHFPRAGVAMQNALADCTHQLALRHGERRTCCTCVTGGEGLVELAQKRPNARSTRLVDFGAALDFANGFLGAGIVSHRITNLWRTTVHRDADLKTGGADIGEGGGGVNWIDAAGWGHQGEPCSTMTSPRQGPVTA